MFHNVCYPIDHSCQEVAKLMARWEAIAELMASAMEECHPPEKTWKSTCITKPDKKAIKEFVKDPNMILIGPISASTTSFLASIKSFCKETHLEPFRRWYDEESTDDSGKSLDALAQAQKASKLALAVATAAKAVHLKLPKTTERKDKKDIVEKTKAHIDKAQLGKAHAACAFPF